VLELIVERIMQVGEFSLASSQPFVQFCTKTLLAKNKQKNVKISKQIG